MPGTVQLVDRRLLFRFPYDPASNTALRQLVGGGVRWDPQQRGFTLQVSRVRSDPGLTGKLTRFIAEHELTPDASVRELLAFREVKDVPAPASAQYVVRPDSLGPGQLRADLLPGSTWGSNLRGVFSREDWDKLRIPVCASAGNVCEVCGAQAYMDSGRKRRPDCHELWIFEHADGRTIQRLDRLIALCPDCHRVQHIGLAGVNAETDLVRDKLQQVNGWTRAQAADEISRAWAEYERRQRHHWDLDLSALRGSITIDGYPNLYIPARDRERLGNSYYG